MSLLWLLPQGNSLVANCLVTLWRLIHVLFCCCKKTWPVEESSGSGSDNSSGDSVDEYCFVAIALLLLTFDSTSDYCHEAWSNLCDYCLEVPLRIHDTHVPLIYFINSLFMSVCVWERERERERERGREGETGREGGRGRVGGCVRVLGQVVVVTGAVAGVVTGAEPSGVAWCPLFLAKWAKIFALPPSIAAAAAYVAHVHVKHHVASCTCVGVEHLRGLSCAHVHLLWWEIACCEMP